MIRVIIRWRGRDLAKVNLVDLPRYIGEIMADVIKSMPREINVHYDSEIDMIFLVESP